MISIYEHVQALRIIDGHEHLRTAANRREMNTDFFGLLHYYLSDMVTAGMDWKALDDSHYDEERARTFLDFWALSKNTTYARMVRWAVEDLYGMEDWTIQGILQLNEQVRRSSQDPDWYHHVLQEKAGIDLALTLIQTTQVDFSLFRPVMFFDPIIMLRSLKNIEQVEEMSGHTVHTMNDYIQALEALFAMYVSEGLVASKIGVAYVRSLRVEKPTRHEAEHVFNQIMNLRLGESLTQDEAQPLQDYLIHRVIQCSISYHLPIQIHTGHHEPSVTGNGNIITNSKVTDLLPILLEYKEASFVLLHGGYPYHSEYLTIAKNFPNVYADMTWLYIISPTVSKQILHQLIDMVPHNKILGFGGDYHHVENTYAHARLARMIIADVLSERIKEGSLSEQEARQFANKVLRDNLIQLYKLGDLS